jgi:hypothetical protein
MNTDADRRKHSRITFDAPARLEAAGSSQPATVHDLSLKGVLLDLQTTDRLESGKYTLTISLSEAVEIVMQLELTHQENQRAGFRCLNIDIDSLTHLRKIVEYNIGDPSLLDREFNLLFKDS